VNSTNKEQIKRLLVRKRVFLCLILIPLGIALLLLVSSFQLRGRFKPNPRLQARLNEATLTKEQYYGQAYRIASSQFICAGTAKWSGGGGGLWVRDGWTTAKATFRVFLEEIGRDSLYQYRDKKRIDAGNRSIGPIYVEVTDVFGMSLEIKSVTTSPLQLNWIAVQRWISSGVFRAMDMVLILAYASLLIMWWSRRYRDSRSCNLKVEDTQQDRPLDG
jgi:hypothetical protein